MKHGRTQHVRLLTLIIPNSAVVLAGGGVDASPARVDLGDFDAGCLEVIQELRLMDLEQHLHALDFDQQDLLDQEVSPELPHDMPAKTNNDRVLTPHADFPLPPGVKRRRSRTPTPGTQNQARCTFHRTGQ